MRLHISVDPSSGPVSISVDGESCVIDAGPTFSNVANISGSVTPPTHRLMRRVGPFIGVVVVIAAATVVAAGFGSMRASNASSKDVATASIATVPLRTPPLSRATGVRPPDQQGQRVEQALNGQAVITPPPSAPAKGAGNPFGLE